MHPCCPVIMYSLYIIIILGDIIIVYFREISLTILRTKWKLLLFMLLKEKTTSRKLLYIVEKTGGYARVCVCVCVCFLHLSVKANDMYVYVSICDCSLIYYSCMCSVHVFFVFFLSFLVEMDHLLCCDDSDYRITNCNWNYCCDYIFCHSKLKIIYCVILPVTYSLIIIFHQSRLL